MRLSSSNVMRFFFVIVAAPLFGRSSYGYYTRSRFAPPSMHCPRPPKVEYNLTEMGQSFREPVSALGYWALDHLATIDAAREAYDANATTLNN